MGEPLPVPGFEQNEDRLSSTLDVDGVRHLDRTTIVLTKETVVSARVTDDGLSVVLSERDTGGGFGGWSVALTPEGAAHLGRLLCEAASQAARRPGGWPMAGALGERLGDLRASTERAARDVAGIAGSASEVR